MKTARVSRLASATVLLLTLVLVVNNVGHAQSPRLTSYQGRLIDDIGTPIDTTVDITFRIYDSDNGGSPVWTQVHPDVAVQDGLFNVMLSFVSNAPSVFTGPSRWMTTQAGDGVESDPRIQISQVPYAYRAEVADTAEYAMASGTSGGSGWTDDGTVVRLANDDDSVGIGTATPLQKLYVMGNCRVTGSIMVGPGAAVVGADANSLGVSSTTRGDSSVVGGGGGNWTDAGATYAVISGGYWNQASARYSSIGGGWHNECDGEGATIAGGVRNVTLNDYATISGGYYNRASGSHSTVGGGTQDTAYGNFATIGGGIHNLVNDDYGFIGGGHDNTVHATYGGVAAGYNNLAGGSESDTAAFVGGGSGNQSTGMYATVGGGLNNAAEFWFGVVGGGWNNIAHSTYSTVAGGSHNEAHSEATVGGGYDNIASGVGSTVAGGAGNDANGVYSGVAAGKGNQAGADGLDTAAFVGGGEDNLVTAKYATVTGGFDNQATADFATVGGGLDNSATGDHSTIGGGWTNDASGDNATVPGGYNNEATGDDSFAAGREARAIHDGSFVWADHRAVSVTSTGPDQFLISAAGGVGINNSTPLGSLDIAQNSDEVCLHFSNGTRDITWAEGHTLQLGEWNGSDWTERMRISSSGNVGIDMPSPSYRLDVGGDIRCDNLVEKSDIRLKQNIGSIDHALDKVDAMRGVSFEWTDQVKSDEGRQLGVIAQEVETVLPELVATDNDGYKSVNYTKLTAVLIEAIKELNSQNRQLQDRVKALEAR